MSGSNLSNQTVASNHFESLQLICKEIGSPKWMRRHVLSTQILPSEVSLCSWAGGAVVQIWVCTCHSVMGVDRVFAIQSSSWMEYCQEWHRCNRRHLPSWLIWSNLHAGKQKPVCHLRWHTAASSTQVMPSQWRQHTRKQEHKQIEEI